MLLTIDIRAACPADAGDLVEVHGASWREAYAGILPARSLLGFLNRRDVAWWVRTIRNARVLVIEVGERVVGYATLGRNRTHALPQKAEIYELYLLPEFQGIGLGRRLFERARAKAAALYGPGTIVWAIEENERAMAFYERMGGRDVAEGAERFERRVLNKVAFSFD